ncbi:leucine-rich repeat domain-containing protein [Planctomycetota bacterium]
MATNSQKCLVAVINLIFLNSIIFGATGFGISNVFEIDNRYVSRILIDGNRQVSETNEHTSPTVQYTFTCLKVLNDGTDYDISNEAEWQVSSNDVSIKGGILTVGTVQKDTTVIITAQYGDKTETREVTIHDYTELTGVTVTGSPTVEELGSYQYECEAHYNNQNPEKVTTFADWSVDHEAVTINHGILDVGAFQKNDLVDITAEYGDKSCTLSVTVFDITVLKLVISGPTSVHGGEQATYTCMADYDNEPDDDVTEAALWSVSNETVAFINQGTLISQQVPQTTSVDIMATYGGEDASYPIKITYVPIIDPNLREAIQDALDSHLPEPLSWAELDKLGGLRAQRRGIVNLSGLQQATGLTYLDLSENPINDLGVIKALTNLKTLKLNSSFPMDTDLSFVENWGDFYQLERLHLDGNRIQDITPLAALKDLLKVLTLNNNQLHDIQLFSDYFKLQTLELNDNSIEDIAPLAELFDKAEPTLETVTLEGNKLNEQAYVILWNMHDKHAPIVTTSFQASYSPNNKNPVQGLIATLGHAADAPSDYIRIKWLRHNNGPIYPDCYYQVSRATEPDWRKAQPIAVRLDGNDLKQTWFSPKVAWNTDHNGMVVCEDFSIEPNTPYYYWVLAAIDDQGTFQTGKNKTHGIGYIGKIPPIYVDNTADELLADGSIYYPYRYIAAAIGEAISGVQQEIILLPGEYYESINFEGKAITVRSNEPLNEPHGSNELGMIRATIIDGQATRCGLVVFEKYKDRDSIGRDSILQGLTISNAGGGRSGGGILCKDDSSPTIKNCLIMGNQVDSYGAAILCEGEAAPRFENCTIVGNRSRDGVISLPNNASADLNEKCQFINCIIVNNRPESIDAYGSEPDMMYSLVDGTWYDNNNAVSNDPMFVDLGYWEKNGQPLVQDESADRWHPGDYHLQSREGRFDSTINEWSEDANNSPCIDSGDPNSNHWQYEPLTGHGGRVNMGLYGGTPEASRSLNYKVIHNCSLDEDPSDPNIYFKGWTGEWQYGTPQALCDDEDGQGCDPLSGFQGGAYVFGVNLQGDGNYGNDLMDPPSYLTAGPFDCSGYREIQLDFRRWLNTDYAEEVIDDIHGNPVRINSVHNTIKLFIGSDMSEDFSDDTKWAVIWHSRNENEDDRGVGKIMDSDWQHITKRLELADDQDQVYIRWGYQVLNDMALQYGGWNLDEIRILGEEIK